LQNNEQGVAMITYTTPAEAEDCVTMMNFRVLRGRQLTAEIYDGHTKYNIHESKESEQKRIDTWHKYVLFDFDK
jgi:HIV Tat-specific factor 1